MFVSRDRWLTRIPPTFQSSLCETALQPPPPGPDSTPPEMARTDPGARDGRTRFRGPGPPSRRAERPLGRFPSADRDRRRGARAVPGGRCLPGRGHRAMSGRRRRDSKGHRGVEAGKMRLRRIPDPAGRRHRRRAFGPRAAPDASAPCWRRRPYPVAGGGGAGPGSSRPIPGAHRPFPVQRHGFADPQGPEPRPCRAPDGHAARPWPGLRYRALGIQAVRLAQGPARDAPGADRGQPVSAPVVAGHDGPGAPGRCRPCRNAARTPEA